MKRFKDLEIGQKFVFHGEPSYSQIYACEKINDDVYRILIEPKPEYEIGLGDNIVYEIIEESYIDPWNFDLKIRN